MFASKGHRAEIRDQHPFRSILSFAFASAIVCHCMFDGASAPPHASGLM
jgi:hypothetical protein